MKSGSLRLIAEQIIATIVHFWKEAPDLAHHLREYCSFDETVGHLKIRDGGQFSRWPPLTMPINWVITKTGPI